MDHAPNLQQAFLWELTNLLAGLIKMPREYVRAVT